jgi:GNAT superfamily N-acetyltransferase
MKIAVREADLDGDAAELVAFLEGQLADHTGSARYDWLYRRNPFGAARAWIATDEAGRIVGAAAAFPRPIVVDGAEVPGFNLGDFAIDPQYRALGPALRLQRALLDEVARAGALAYDHPSAGMLAVYRWLKVEPTGQVVRYAKPLAVRGLLGAPGNTLLRLADSVGRPRSSATAAPLDGRFEGTTEALARRAVAACRVSALRSAAYLNWRYLDSPSGGHEVIAVAGNEACEGFAVVRRAGRHAVLRELVAEPGSDAGNALLSQVVDSLRKAGVETLSAPLLESSPLVPLLRRWGFHARESTPFVVVTDPASPLREIVTQGRYWMLTDGDRDV